MYILHIFSSNYQPPLSLLPYHHLTRSYTPRTMVFTHNMLYSLIFGERYRKTQSKSVLKNLFLFPLDR